ncbi:restriction endonuclease subunit S [Aquimarina megaterium]|uniref:restriction endonuclease subunit S n=1 Tax=Aquimarina megaterium TaxID=1443666 RepID=UPI000472CF04|nr:restriction endonuclease subunit S [Aquimarina megaterium]
MQLLEHFHKLSIYPKNAKELKGLILQLAVQGKLTKKWREINSNVEPASELLERIKEEKQRLIAKKKIKKEKLLPQITKDEIPNELPEDWIWCRFQEVFDIRDGTHDSPKNVTGTNSYPLITSKDFKNGAISFLNAKRISKEDYIKIIQRSLVEEDDILFSMIGGNIGSQVMVKGDTNFAIKNVALFKYYKKSLSVPSFLKKFSEHIAYSLQNKASGGAQPFVSLTFLRQLLIPFPPLEEQKAIVEIVEQLFKEIEQLEQLTDKRIQLKEDFVVSALHRLQENNTQEEWVYLQKHFKTFFTEENNIKKLRETILQLAVQGKLTKDWRKQNPNIEPTLELLERIKAEKQQLITEKKIKKEKPLPPITEDEIPYGLPESWEWCKMQEVGLFRRGKSKHRPRNDIKLFVNGKYPLVQTGDISAAKHKGGFITTHKSSYNDFGLAQSILWDKGTLCITIAANIAETGFLSYDACFPDSVVGFTSLSEDVISKYVQFFIDITKSDLERYAPSTAQKNINLGILFGLNFPLPPLEEQKVIVQKVNTLMGLCDQLEVQIKTGKEQSEKLMQSVLREVFTTEEKEESKIEDLIPNINKYMQVAMITQKMENAFGFNHGKVEKQKTSFLLKAIKKQPIPYNFEKSNYGTFSWELSEDLDSSPFLCKNKTDKGLVYQIKLDKQQEILTALNAPENSSFVQAIDELVQVYQNPLVAGKTDKIELLNTICKLILDLKSKDLDIIYKAMQDWQIKQDGYSTKADKFLKKDVEKMLKLVIKLGWDKDLIKM